MNFNSTQGNITFTDPNGLTTMYFLKSMSFHSPSEHTINGMQYDAELEILHQTQDGSQTAILSVLFSSQMNIGSCLITDLGLSSFSSMRSSTQAAQSKTIALTPLGYYIGRIMDSFYYYKGSLTTPPCTENIDWFIFSEIQLMSIA